MNDLRDVQRIINEFYTQTGQWMEASAEAQVLPPDACWRQAERQLSKGLAELNDLNLSPENRRGFKRLRDAFETVIKACRAGAKGRDKQANQLAEKSGRLLNQYVKEVSSDG